jgi:hypothetical protein
VTPSGPAPEGAPFADAAADALKQAALAALLRTPELRAVQVVFAWAGKLNDDPAVPKGVWVGAEGEVRNPADVAGSVFMTFEALDAQLRRLYEIADAVRLALAAAAPVLAELSRAQEAPDGRP